MWRVVSIDMTRNPPVDWTFEREWRVPDELRFELRCSAALVENWKDVDEIFDRFDGQPPCAGVIPIGEMFARRSP
jgi:hypothetical protein